LVEQKTLAEAQAKMTKALLAIAALLVATSVAHARPELSKTQSWKLT
jgi:hypothetical protein